MVSKKPPWTFSTNSPANRHARDRFIIHPREKTRSGKAYRGQLSRFARWRTRRREERSIVPSGPHAWLTSIVPYPRTITSTVFATAGILGLWCGP